MVQNVPRSQSASAQGFLPPYFRPGSSQKGGMPIMVNMTICINNCIQHFYK